MPRSQRPRQQRPESSTTCRQVRTMQGHPPDQLALADDLRASLAWGFTGWDCVMCVVLGLCGEASACESPRFSA